MRSRTAFASGALISLLIGLTGCGGGSSTGGLAGIGGTGVVSSGSITGFGSIFVNGVEYEIESGTCEVDDRIVSGSCQANLALGMVVTVEGTVSGSTGTASRVVFDSAVEGPVTGLTTGPDGLTKSFNVLGVEVTVDKAGTRFDDTPAGFTFDTLADNNVVEVSGFTDAGGILQATFIERKADAVVIGSTPVELKGTVSGAPGGGAGIGDDFTIGTVTLTILSTADLSDIPGGLVRNGDFVEAKGVLAGAGRIDVNKVEPERRGIGDDGDELSLEGLVSGFTGNPASFQVAGQTVDASRANFSPVNLQLVDGQKVEVEGTLSGGILIATRLGARGNQIKIDAPVSALGASTVDLRLGGGSITVSVDSRTRLEDRTGGQRRLALSDIGIGDFLRIRGFQDGSGVVASQIRRDSADDIILQGPVDRFVNGSTLTILGVTFFTSGATRFEDRNDAGMSSSAFFIALSPGDLVKVKDLKPGDQTADEVDQEG